ncbi:hypothetical protein [Brevundimonas sp. FT23028]|uniref:hypothetical protein n=1 Tax=Brevundimonas sp. FT23028 TaxID=3393748 RepID=UPI003B58A0A3
MNSDEKRNRLTVVAEALWEIVRQEFWIVLKAYFAPIFGTIAVIGHLREVIRLTDRGAL